MAVHPQDGETKSDLMGLADKKLYELKHAAPAAASGARVIPLESHVPREAPPAPSPAAPPRTPKAASMASGAAAAPSPQHLSRSAKMGARLPGRHQGPRHSPRSGSAHRPSHRPKLRRRSPATRKARRDSRSVQCRSARSHTSAGAGHPTQNLYAATRKRPDPPRLLFRLLIQTQQDPAQRRGSSSFPRKRRPAFSTALAWQTGSPRVNITSRYLSVGRTLFPWHCQSFRLAFPRDPLD